MELTKRQAIIITLVFLLFVQLLVFYLFLVRPASADNEALTARTEILESELIIAEAESTTGPAEVDAETVVIEEKLPLTKAEDQILLAMQSAELVSGTQIDIVEFGDEEILEPLIFNEEDIEEEDDQAVETDPVTPPGEGLQSVAFTAEVSSPDFNSLQKFIKEMERLDRVMNFEGLEFEQLTDEQVLLSAENNQTIVLRLTANAYFYHDKSNHVTE